MGQSPSCNMLFGKIVKIRARAHFMLLGEIARKNFVSFIEEFRKSVILFVRCMHKRNWKISLHFIYL